jgi:hypothetical protein
MQDEDTPRDAEAPEQINHGAGAPGPAVRIQDGKYRIYTTLTSSTRMGVSINPESINNIHKVWLITVGNESASIWDFTYDADRGDYLISNDTSSLALGRATTNIDQAVALPKISEVRTKFWVLKEADPDTYYIESVYDGRLIEVEGANTSNKTNIVLRPHIGATKQKFKLERARSLS